MKHKAIIYLFILVLFITTITTFLFYPNDFDAMIWSVICIMAWLLICTILLSIFIKFFVEIINK